MLCHASGPGLVPCFDVPLNQFFLKPLTPRPLILAPILKDCNVLNCLFLKKRGKEKKKSDQCAAGYPKFATSLDSLPVTS